jgi:hypothetical protein
VISPPNVGLYTDSFRVPLAAPSMAIKSSLAELVAVVVRALMRMSAMLGYSF